MVKIKKGTKYFIIFIIFFMSFYVAAKYSHILSGFNSQTIKPNLAHANEIFNKSDNYKKIKIIIPEAKDENVANKVATIIGNYNDVKIKYNEKRQNYYTTVLEIPDTLYRNFIAELRTVKMPAQENLITSPKSELKIDIKEHIENALLTKETIKKELNKRLTPERFKGYQTELMSVQAQIDSLKNLENFTKNNMTKDIILLSIYKNIKVNPLADATKKFFIALFVSVILLSIVGMLLYLFMTFILYLMRKMGLKTATGGGSGKYNYNYNYNKGYYGRGGIKKVKRIYKDKSSSDKSEM